MAICGCSARHPFQACKECVSDRMIEWPVSHTHVTLLDDGECRRCSGSSTSAPIRHVSVGFVGPHHDKGTSCGTGVPSATVVWSISLLRKVCASSAYSLSRLRSSPSCFAFGMLRCWSCSCLPAFVHELSPSSSAQPEESTTVSPPARYRALGDEGRSDTRYVSLSLSLSLGWDQA